MATKALKGVSEEKWAQFKAIAAERDVTMGQLFNEAVDAVKEKKSRWEIILANRIKGNSEKDWEEFRKITKEFRSRLKMRQF
jgi:hypothetical protein